MQKRTKVLYRDIIIDELYDLIRDKEFCVDMYDKTNDSRYLDTLDLVHERMRQEKYKLNQLLEGRVE